MENIVLLDTAVGSTNKGDDIIMSCIEEELHWLLKKYYPLHVSTHLRSFGMEECFGKLPDSAFEIARAKYKFVCGTNLLSANMFHRTNQWNINLWNCKPIRGSILFGVGSVGGSRIKNIYTRKLYKKLLSDKYIHSVRTESAYKLVKSLGLSCINTGCVTLWKLTPEFCTTIPTKKKNHVIFTLTDYCRDVKRDQKMISILKKNYDKLSFWIQGVYDLEYLKSLTDIDKIDIIPASLKAYSLLLENQIDYVGTRLHAGIYAMRHSVRSIIINVDQRMDEMAAYIPNNFVTRLQIETLEDKIQSQFQTEINLNWDAINLWKGQFT